MDIAGERERDRKPDVLLERDERRRNADHLLAVARAARPGELQPPVPIQGRVPPRRVDPVTAVMEKRVGCSRICEQHWRKHERLDVPHDLAAVVVVVRPVGETEHRRAEQRRRVRGRVQVVEGGIRQRLPPVPRTDEVDATAPEVVPRLAILLTEPIESEVGADGGKARRLAARLAVALAWDKRRDHPQHVRGSRMGAKAVRRPQRRDLVVLLAGLRDVLAAFEPCHVRGAAAAERAVRLPQE